MASITLPQNEANNLISMEKVLVDDQQEYFPNPGGSLSVPLTSLDQRETFLLDIGRGKINLAKVKFQNRTRKSIVLVRLDIEGSPHRNPDGEIVPPPHLHVYREGYGDKWAEPIDPKTFSDTSDIYNSMEDFMTYCNITQPPLIERKLF